MSIRFVLLAALLLSFATGCASAKRKMMYNAYEVVGIQKRDILKDRVDDARDEQKEAGEKFTDALEQFRSLYGIEGAEKLEAKYDDLRSSYERAEDQAEDVRDSIKKVEVVASDLFKEWEKEAAQIETASLRARSRETLADTRRKYADLQASLSKAEARMEPVLAKFKDQVLYLKHNLNAQAISSLKGEAASIQKDIERLIAEMNRSIADADRFIADMK